MRAYARVLRADAACRGELLFPPTASGGPRRATLEELEGRRTAERIVRQAREDARAIVERAASDAKEAVREAEAEARARHVAEWLARRGEEQGELERDRDRLVAVAVALAERLLGAALELDPGRIASLARGVLSEARGARRAVIEAHPLDAAALRDRLTTAGLGVQSVEVREQSGLARGDLLLHTDLGTIDARIPLRFERLAAALRDAGG